MRVVIADDSAREGIAGLLRRAGFEVAGEASSGDVGRIAPRPLLLIAAPDSPNGEELNRRYHRAAGRPKELWEIPGARHVGGLDARPREYERRVVGFFNRALLGSPAHAASGRGPLAS